MAIELYRKHRPTIFKQVVGQDKAVAMLEEMVKKNKVPHAILLSGPSGTGKTTLARILKSKLNCSDHDFAEINCADFRGIDMIREIRQRMGLSPLKGTCRIWLIDECQKLTGDAMSAALKLLEDTPKHVYFLLATTDPGKLLKTIHTRCTEIKLGNLDPKCLEDLVRTIANKEGFKPSEDVVERLAEVADGSARKALVLLHQVMELDKEEDQLEAIQSSDSKQQAINIAKALMDPRTKWSEMAGILKEVDEEPEGIRHLVLAYSTKVLLGGGRMSERAFVVINAFRDHWFDCRRAGLVASCWEVLGRK